MGIEPYQVTSSLHGILTQRLLRKLSKNPGTARYQGRTPVAEFAALDSTARAAILERADADALRKIVGAQAGHATIHAAAQALVDQGITDAAEVRRVLGDAHGRNGEGHAA
jgi:type II secretory ATPase GspE/PulE/Tfp pilus assembly ATPase PilB-like protein